MKIDIIDKLPVPFGLIRYGVAPDHPEVKNVINTFHKVATNPRVDFIGNVNIGTDISIKDLRENYDAVLLVSDIWNQLYCHLKYMKNTFFSLICNFIL